MSFAEIASQAVAAGEQGGSALNGGKEVLQTLMLAELNTRL